MRDPITHTRILAFAVALPVTLAFSHNALAQNSTPAAESPKGGQVTATDQPAPAVVVGQQVAIDPATKKLQAPSPEESRALEAAIRRLTNRSAVGLKTIVRRGGVESMYLQRRFVAVSVAQVGAHGSLSTTCVTNQPSEARASAGTSHSRPVQPARLSAAPEEKE